MTLAPSLTDVVLGLGLRDRLVGVTRLDDAPEVAALPRVGGFLDPNPEAILGLSPDLVLWVTDGGALPAVRRIAELSAGSRRPFPILALHIVSVADVLATPRVVGEALGVPDAGARLSRELEAAVDDVKRRAARLPRRRALFVVGREPLVVAGPGSFPDELLRIAGADNVVKGARPWPVYPLEKAVADDPERRRRRGGAGARRGHPAARRHPGRAARRDRAAPERRPPAAPDRAWSAGSRTLFRGLHPEATR